MKIGLYYSPQLDKLIDVTGVSQTLVFFNGDTESIDWTTYIATHKEIKKYFIYTGRV